MSGYHTPTRPGRRWPFTRREPCRDCTTHQATIANLELQLAGLHAARLRVDQTPVSTPLRPRTDLEPASKPTVEGAAARALAATAVQPAVDETGQRIGKHAVDAATQHLHPVTPLRRAS